LVTPSFKNDKGEPYQREAKFVKVLEEVVFARVTFTKLPEEIRCTLGWKVQLEATPDAVDHTTVAVSFVIDRNPIAKGIQSSAYLSLVTNGVEVELSSLVLLFEVNRNV